MAGKRELKVVILGDSSKAQRAFNSLERSGSTLGSKMDGLGSKMAGVARGIAAAGVAAGAAAGAFGFKAIKAASDLEEQVSKVGVVFGDSVKIVHAGAKEMADAFGIPHAEFLEAAGAIGLVGKASGLAQKEAAELGVKFAKLGIDASSFYNVPVEEALIKIRQGLVGEAEPLRAFGVLLSEDALQAEALAQGLGKGAADAGKSKAAIQALAIAQRKAADVTKEYGADSIEAQKATLAVTKAENALGKATEGVKVELTDAQKVQLRSAIIDRQMADAQGDRARTAKSFANQLRELQGRVTIFSAAVGTKLLPYVLRAFNLMKQWAPVAQRLGERVARELTPAFKTIGNFVSQTVVPAFGRLSDWFQNTFLPAVTPAADFLKGALWDAFDKVRDVVERNREKFKEIADFLLLELVPQLMELVGVLIHELTPAFTFVIESGVKLIEWFKELYRWINNTVNAADELRSLLRLLTGNLGFNPQENYKNITPEEFDKTFGVERSQKRKGGGYGMTGSWTDNSVTVNVNGGKSDKETGETVAREVGWARRGWGR